jgi:hypothetical protein
MNSKGGILGTSIPTIIAAAAIIIILILFVFSSTLIKVFANIDDGIQVDKKFDKSEREYFESYKKLVEQRRKISEERLVDVELSFGGEDE